jgi:hypothetical protein
MRYTHGKRLESPINNKSLGADKPRSLNKIDNIWYGYLYLWETDINFKKIQYLGAVNLKYKYI